MSWNRSLLGGIQEGTLVEISVAGSGCCHSRKTKDRDTHPIHEHVTTFAGFLNPPTRVGVPSIFIPVVPHKAVAEVSRRGKL